ncbi:MAG: rhomboid family intramembrane serine protease [Clostridium sp.]|nr:rhomboid family intramembrane serine protease [Clostridium sp.]MCM1444655.1 rhomboid family intramembrane serine protease [Candidatus Amulumruptor caecigallinarius]
MINKSDEIVMKLLHYFITEKGYNPIVLHGAKDEIWLENLQGNYKIVRIVSNYIHNNEQLDFDMFKTKQIVRKIKKTTFTFNVNTLSIFINLGENVKVENEYNNIEIVNLKKIDDLKNYKSVMEVFPDITKKNNFKEKGLQLFAKLTNEINNKNEEEGIKANDIFRLKKPVITTILISINIIVFILMYILGNGSRDYATLINFGAFRQDLVLSGEYYRIITSAFIHIGTLHLLFNCYSLYIIGRQLESFLGRIKFLVIYILSAIGGNLISMIFPVGLSAGASGAIFGLLGSLLYFGYNYRVYLGTVMKSQIIPLIMVNLIIGFMVKEINVAAHIGGLIIGITSTMALGLKYKSKISQKVNGYVLTAIFLGFLIYMGFFM